MKKLRFFLLTVMLLTVLAGCGVSAPTPRQDEFSIRLNGTDITLNAEAAPVIEALGEPRSYTEEPSCAFEGLDKTYYYGSFYLATYPSDGTDYVYSIWFVDDSAATEDGIHIGSTKAEMEAIYGAGCFGTTDSYTQVSGNSRLIILLTDETVSSIQYEVIIG